MGGRSGAAARRRAAVAAGAANSDPADTSDPAGSADLYRSLLESAPDAMVIVDSGGIIRLVNAKTEELFGHQRSELLGRPVEMLLPGRLRAGHAAQGSWYSASPRARPMGAGLGLLGLRRDGTEFPVEISLSPLQTGQGLLVSAAVRDATERRAAELRMAELSMIVQTSQDAIITATPDGVITYWNEAAACMYGYSADEAVGRSAVMLAPPGGAGDVAALLARLRRGERIEHYETLRRARSGDLLDVDIVAWPACDPAGQVTGVCAIVRDVGEQRRASGELTRLHEQQRQVALTLQRDLMGPVPQVPGIETASRYRPATRGAGVGGDWFDLIPLGAGRAAVLIGDVMGRGLEAATVMGRLRSAGNALARTGMSPQQLMSALDSVARDLPGQLVTCCYLVIDATGGELTACSAGHLPILAAGPDGTAGPLPIPVSVPLGVGGIPHAEAAFAVPPGTTLVLYTDGLIETRDSDLEARIGTLAAEAAAALAGSAGLEQAADQILPALLTGSGQHADDVTLLLVRMPAPPLASASTSLPPEPRQVGAGRRFVRETLAAWGQQELAAHACLLVSEILTNAIRHACQPIELRLHRRAGELVAEIFDDDAQLPQRMVPGLAEESGRGLMIVDALAADWGARLSGPGKVVWFTLASDGAAASGPPALPQPRRAGEPATAPC